VAEVAQVVIRTFDMGNGVGAKDKQRAEEAPVLAVLGTSQDDTEAWMHAGQALERVLLTARREGLQASFLNQPIQVNSLTRRKRILWKRRCVISRVTICVYLCSPVVQNSC